MKKLNRAEAVKILQEYVSNELGSLAWYGKIAPQLKAIIFYGSTAKGQNREDSDLDICIFVPLETEERYTQGEYFYSYKGYEINIVIRSIERLRELARKSDDEFEKEVFQGCEILFESDTEVRELLEYWGAG